MNKKVQVQEKVNGDVLILALKGRLDAVSSGDLERQIFDYIEHGHRKVLFNLVGVDYLSSVGMRLLLRTTKKLRLLAGKLVVCEVNSNVMDILQMSGFDHVIDFSASESEALRKF
jgi:anti-sigma B factor antagonist/stage II sporulation protein AA (anti-sigma F factor antagonist)